MVKITLKTIQAVGSRMGWGSLNFMAGMRVSEDVGEWTRRSIETCVYLAWTA